MVAPVVWMAAAGAFKAGTDRTDAIVAANNEIAYYNTVIQNAINDQTLTSLDIINVEEVGRFQENANRLKYKHMIGSQKTVYAGRNIKLGAGGSPLDVMLSTKVIEAYQRETIARNVDNQVFNLEMRKLGSKKEEQLARNKQATINPTARGNAAFFGTLLSTAGKVGAAGGYDGGSSPAGFGSGGTSGSPTSANRSAWV
jgi:hypothetical protein